MKFRPLEADEIECRVATVSEKGVSLLLYKNARCDMKILDETVGAENWEREHYECKGNLFCKVSININYSNSELPSEWVSKSDCGAESYTEKEKGESSDSFKRACFNWGIGRELYTAPFIWVNANDVNLIEYKGKLTTRDRFSVSNINIIDGKITNLSIKNDKTNKIVFAYPISQKSKENQSNAPQKQKADIPRITQEQGQSIKEWLPKAGMTEEKLVTAYKIKSLSQLPASEYPKIIKRLEEKAAQNGQHNTK